MQASNIFDKIEPVKCVLCGKNLINDIGLSMVQIRTDDSGKITKVIPCCKGECDRKLKSDMDNNEHDGWKDLSEFTNPFLFMKHIMSVINSMYDKEGFANKEAFETYKELVLNCYPYVTRNLTDTEAQTAKYDAMLPF